MALSPVVIEFMQRGLPDVQRAFRSIEQTVTQSERNTTRTVSTGVKAKEREFQKLAKEAEKWQRDQVRAAERSLQSEVRATEQASRRMLQIRERSATMAGKFAEKQVKEEARLRERHTRESVRKHEQYIHAIGRGTANTVGAVIRGGGAVARTVTQLGGGFSVGDSLAEKVSLDRQATLLANKAILPGGARASKGDILSKVRAASIATNTDEDKLLAAWGSYTDKTGDFKGGEANLQFFGKLAKGTGADINEIGKTAGQLRVQNRNLGDKEMKQLLLDIVQQGRSGSVDMPELARSASKITRTSSSYAGTQTENQRKLLGLSQVAVRTSGSVDEAATVLSNISADALKHGDKIQAALGKGAINDRGQIAKSPEEFLADVMDKTGGNMQQIQKMGFGMRSMKMFQALAPQYEEGLAKGGKSGARAAVLADMKSFTGATYDEKSLEKDFAEVMKSSAEQFEGAVRTMKQEVGDKLVPELAKLIPVMRQLTPPLVRFLDAMIAVAEWASGHPFESLAMLMTAAILKELAAAQIGQTIRSIITSSAGGGGGVPGVGGGVGSGATTATGAGLGAGLLIAGGSLMQADALGRVADIYSQGSMMGSKRAGELGDMVRAGKADEARAEIEQAKQDSGALQWATTAGTMLTRGMQYINPISYATSRATDYATEKATGKGPNDVDQAKRTFAASEIAAREQEINNAATKLATAMTNAANTVDAANPNADARNKPLSARGATQ